MLKEQGPLLALILFIILIYVLQTVLVEWNYSRLMLVPGNFMNAWESLRSGNISGPTLLEFGPLLSHAFLHGSIGHVFGNMIFLWIFAALTAELLGHRWMFFTFIFTAICGGICHVALNPGEFVPSLGASGAVTGFEGLYLGMAVRWHLPNPHIWPMARPVPPAQLAALGILGLIMDFMGYIGGAMGVAYGAHLGGFIGGMVLGAAVVPMPRVANIR
ncbi:MAG: rhomboid family intramembrane serine protease [Armatimonadetes bacterium]|nr:rhomboid family intramembrane serine protease [Akkermansiaceae bacterium]